MKKTRLCALLGIDYPILQGAMTWIANAELAAAVSNAGALGIISPNAGMARDGDMRENLRAQIRKARSLTSRPFGVNVSLVSPEVEGLLDVAIVEGVKIVVTSAGSPSRHTRFLKGAGLTVLHLVSSVKQARKAEEDGVGAVIAEGYEAGGHNGLEELATFVLVPQVVDAVKIPVIAAGGIADARGFVAALALGAEGVQLGTRFVATRECIAHPRFKEAILQATDTGTVVMGRKMGPIRILKGPLADKLLQMEREGASAEELRSFLGVSRARRGQLEGDLVEGEAYCGAVAAMIKEVLAASEVVQRLVEGQETVLSRLRQEW